MDLLILLVSPQKLEYQRQVGTVELVIACHEVHLQRQQRRAHKDVIQPGGMVADEKEGAVFLAEILLKVVMDAILGVNKQLPNQAQCIVNPIGMADFSSVNGSFHRCLFHISLFLPFCVSFLSKMSSPQAAQHNYHITFPIPLSILTFSNF